MATDKLKIIKAFYGGIIRDKKSRINGAAYNIEELDIFSNADYVQAEQIFSSDSMPASTEVYTYCSDAAGTVYGYGKETSGSKVRIVSVATGGADAPGAFSTLMTSADTSNLSYKISPIEFHRTTESPTDYLYYITKNGTTISLKRCRIDGSNEATVGTLTGLDGTNDRLWMKVIFGTLLIGNGRYIAGVDKDGVFTEKYFTLPSFWEAVDICQIGTRGLILARHVDASKNYCTGYWWDLIASTDSDVSGFDDYVMFPHGGPQWIFNQQETVFVFCAIAGKARVFQMSAYAGSVPVELPGIDISNIALESDQTPISAPYMVGVKDKVLYFGLNKTDKTGVYALGRLDADKPWAFILSKRFATTNYANHIARGLLISGPNYYGAFSDNGTASNVRCASRNSPNRSSSGIYESIDIDDDSPSANKDFKAVYLSTEPMPSGTDLNCYVSVNYGSYAEIFRADGTSLNTTSAVQGEFKITNGTQKKAIKIKVELVSSGTNSPKMNTVGLKMASQKVPAPK